MRSGLIRMNREKHYWAVRKQQKKKINRKNMYYSGILRKPRWRQVLKAEGLKDNPFANYYYHVGLNVAMLRIAKSIKKIGVSKGELKSLADVYDFNFKDGN